MFRVLFLLILFVFSAQSVYSQESMLGRLGQNYNVDSPDGKLHADGKGSSIVIKEKTSGKVVDSISLPGPISFATDLVWKPDSKQFAFTHETAGLCVHDMEDKKNVNGFKGLSWKISNQGWSPDSKLFAALGAVPEPSNLTNCLIVWDAQGKEQSRFKRPLYRRLDWSKDSRKIALLDDQQKAVIYDVGTAKVLAEIQTSTRGNSIFAWSPDGKYIAICDVQGEVQIYQGDSGQFVNQHKFESVLEAKWSSDGKQFLVREYLDSKEKTSWKLPFGADGQIVKTAKVELRPGEKDYIPKDLNEAFKQIEVDFSPELVKKLIDGTESDLVKYHHGLGTGIRNNWGLWGGSPLSKFFLKNGIYHPDDMSATILKAYWLHKHNKPFDLKPEAKKYSDYWKAAQKQAEENENTQEKQVAEIRKSMLGLNLKKAECQTLNLAPRKEAGLRIRYISPYGNGIFMTAKKYLPLDDFCANCFYFDPEKNSISKINAPELDSITSGIVLDGKLYLLGVKGQNDLLLELSNKHRKTYPLPAGTKNWNVLGERGKNLLLVREYEVFEFKNGVFTSICKSETKLPKCLVPPKLVGNRLYFRDEGKNESDKQLSWIQIDKPIYKQRKSGAALTVSSFSAPDPDCLWMLEGNFHQSLVRWTKEKGYQYGIYNNRLYLDEGLAATITMKEPELDEISLTCVNATNAEEAEFLGPSGYFRLKNKVLEPIVRFRNTVQTLASQHYSFDPTHMVQTGENQYFIGSHWGGTYILEKDPLGKWTMVSLDEKPTTDLRL